VITDAKFVIQIQGCRDHGLASLKGQAVLLKNHSLGPRVSVTTIALIVTFKFHELIVQPDD
jgi:hypothetical protein